MDPFTLSSLLYAGIAAACASAVFIAYLTTKAIRDFIRKKRTEKALSSESVIIKRQLKTGKYRVIAGFLDGNDIKDAQVWEAKDVDNKIKTLPDGEIIIVR